MKILFALTHMPVIYSMVAMIILYVFKAGYLEKDASDEYFDKYSDESLHRKFLKKSLAYYILFSAFFLGFLAYFSFEFDDAWSYGYFTRKTFFVIASAVLAVCCAIGILTSFLHLLLSTKKSVLESFEDEEEENVGELETQ